MILLFSISVVGIFSCIAVTTVASTYTPIGIFQTVEPTPRTFFPIAQVVYAQPDFNTSTLHPTSQNSLKNAGAIASDRHGGFYVADYGNSRVLHFPLAQKNGVGPQADQIYGQPDYTSNAVNHDATSLNYPHGVASDLAGGLYIADTFNNRVLHYPRNSVTPDRVYGQCDLVSGVCSGSAIGPGTLAHPQGLAVDVTGLYVADTDNNRVLHYSSNSTKADFVYGQGVPGNSFSNATTNTANTGSAGLNSPRDLALNQTGLYVSDSKNNRVLHYELGNPCADYVYGQPNFSADSVQANQGNTHPTAYTLSNPTGIALDRQNRLYIADRVNNRVLYYPPFVPGMSNDPQAIGIYGQLSYSSSSRSTTASTFNGPGALAIDVNGALLVLDIFNQRVLKFG